MLYRLLLRFRRRGLVLAHDLVMIPVAWMGALWLRFNLGAIPEPNLIACLQALPVVFLVQALFFRYFGLYRGLWRFASMPDLVRIVQAATAATATSALVLMMLGWLPAVPRSVFVLYPVLLVLALGGPRFVYRWWKDHGGNPVPGERALMVGAGRAGDQLARDLIRDSRHLYSPVAFVDDNPLNIGREVHGVPVRGSIEDIPRLARQSRADLIIIAIPSAPAELMRRIYEKASETGLPVRTLPAMADVMAGRVAIDELRQVSIEDIVGRSQVELDWGEIAYWLQGRRVMVTGGGGSIGAELCRQVARLDPASLIIVERSEFNLYRIQQELRDHFPEMSLRPALVDINDKACMDRLMSSERPDVIFHAAAYKHVPMLEEHVLEAVHNNVRGTMTVARAAMAYGVERFVLVSTDKAVNPASVMGASKRLAELYCQLCNDSRTRFITVRFGNVLESDGSVLPRFRDQIESGGPVTVTDPEMTRYFMNIPEACQLIMQAGMMGRGGEIFVLDMGEPVRIVDLARQMISLSGKDVDIVFTGLRPGEKLYEELFHEHEVMQRTRNPNIRLAMGQSVDGAWLERCLQALFEACDRGREERVLQLLKEYLPEFNPASTTEQVALPPSVVEAGDRFIRRGSIN